MIFGLHKIEEVKEQFKIAMDDDFNTANGIAAVFELVEAGEYVFIGKTNYLQKY